uniref:Ig-like domain-containing protein n=1 Tax=Hucho hucho TaxID=62062 RepID=A0A4W5PX59_9TELE
MSKNIFCEQLYRKVGEDIVLTPDKSTVTDPITGILWKHGKNKVAEWDNHFGLDIYAAFINRTTLDQATGDGVYSVEFNGKPLKTFTLSVIKVVPKPAITSSCNPDKTSCTLTCEGNTTDAEPVTYRWKLGEGAWEVSGQQKIVSRNDNTNISYTCQLKNPVSEASEDFDKDLFGPGERTGHCPIISSLAIYSISYSQIPPSGCTAKSTMDTVVASLCC